MMNKVGPAASRFDKLVNHELDASTTKVNTTKDAEQAPAVQTENAGFAKTIRDKISAFIERLSSSIKNLIANWSQANAAAPEQQRANRQEQAGARQGAQPREQVTKFNATEFSSSVINFTEAMKKDASSEVKENRAASVRTMVFKFIESAKDQAEKTGKGVSASISEQTKKLLQDMTITAFKDFDPDVVKEAFTYSDTSAKLLPNVEKFFTELSLHNENARTPEGARELFGPALNEFLCSDKTHVGTFLRGAGAKDSALMKVLYANGYEQITAAYKPKLTELVKELGPSIKSLAGMFEKQNQKWFNNEHERLSQVGREIEGRLNSGDKAIREQAQKDMAIHQDNVRNTVMNSFSYQTHTDFNADPQMAEVISSCTKRLCEVICSDDILQLCNEGFRNELKNVADVILERNLKPEDKNQMVNTLYNNTLILRAASVDLGKLSQDQTFIESAVGKDVKFAADSVMCISKIFQTIVNNATSKDKFHPSLTDCYEPLKKDLDPQIQKFFSELGKPELKN